MYDYDYVIIGSGFGGSVSALRLSEKGYKVLVIEKGKWYKKPSDFPTTNWNLKKWLWWPSMGLHGLLRLTFYRHVAILSGVAVGGGSVVYANTLPIPASEFYTSGHWKGLANWEEELKPFYREAEKMLGAITHPYMSLSDNVMLSLAKELGNESAFEKTNVAVYFGQPDITVPDPYFQGKGPDRTGCNLCGGCMLGCRHNAKNTLDKNYLHLAQQLGAKIDAEKEVYDVIPLNANGSAGYEIRYQNALSYFKNKNRITTRGVIFSGGVLGTVRLLLKLKKTSLPNLSEMVGVGVRTNSESLIAVTTHDDIAFSKGIAIGSIVKIDESRHLEPVKYSNGSGFWRLFMAPMVQGPTMLNRLLKMFTALALDPINYMKVFFVDDWSKRSHILLYMESKDASLRFKQNAWGGLSTSLDSGIAPTAFNPIAQEMAHKVEKIINGKAMASVTETLLGIPTTAHILGGACMGNNVDTGVINKYNQVFNYNNMLVCDGSMISANPGVNPSLSITAIAERAMSNILLKANNPHFVD